MSQGLAVARVYRSPGGRYSPKLRMNYLTDLTLNICFIIKVFVHLLWHFGDAIKCMIHVAENKSLNQHEFFLKSAALIHEPTLIRFYVQVLTLNFSAWPGFQGDAFSSAGRLAQYTPYLSFRLLTQVLGTHHPVSVIFLSSTRATLAEVLYGYAAPFPDSRYKVRRRK